MRRFSVPFLAVAIFAGCSSFRSNPDDPPPRIPDESFLTIENRAFIETTIYILRGAQRIRLGNVPGAANRTFTIPPELVYGATRLRVLTEPVGSRAQGISREIVVAEGEHVRMIIPPR